MVHLVCVLPIASGPICVGPVGQDLHTAALTTRFLPALFLQPRTENRELSPELKFWGPGLVLILCITFLKKAYLSV